MLIPNSPQGFNPNTAQNISQTILRTKLAINAILSLSGSTTITPGYLLSKANATANNNTFVVPTAASIEAGNLWVATEGVIPDVLNVDSTQGLVNGALPTFADGTSINVIPFPQNGTLAQMQVSYTDGDVVSVNAPLFVKADGTLTPDVASAISPFTVGYVFATNLTTIASTAVYQVYVILQASINNPVSYNGTPTSGNMAAFGANGTLSDSTKTAASVVTATGTPVSGNLPLWGASNALTDSGSHLKAQTANYAGGSATATVTDASVAATSIVLCQIRASTNAVSVQKVTEGSGSFTVLMSADPGAGTVFKYIVLTAALAAALGIKVDEKQEGSEQKLESNADEATEVELGATEPTQESESQGEEANV